MSRIIGVVQARMGSSRLPGKVMTVIAGKPLVAHIFDRLSRVTSIDETILATTTDPRNEPLVDYANVCGWPVYAIDEEDDLAARLHGAAITTRADAILRVAGDCPLIDPMVLERLVAAFIQCRTADFVSNRVRWSYPLGLSADVISKRALAWCDANLADPHERELFAMWICGHPERFKVVSVEHEDDLSQHKWTVDEPEDLDFVRRVFDALYTPGRVFGLSEVLDFVKTDSTNEQPHLSTSARL